MMRPILLVSLLVVTAPNAYANQPACAASLGSPAGDVVRVSVGSREATLDHAVPYPDELRVYPAGASAVLVAYAARTEHGPTGSATLWRVACKAGAPEPIAHVEGADFGHSTLSPDGRTLLFTGPDGVFALDLTTRKTRRLTQAALDYCQRNQIGTRDVVGGFVAPETLSFERGCGYEHEWHATAMLMRDPLSRRASIAPAPIPFQSIATDAGGGLWLADGVCGDASTYGRVLVSRDQGDHWQRVPIKMFADAPVREILTDATKPNSILVFSFGCASDAHQDPGWVYASDDAKAFRPIKVPPGINASDDAPASEQDPVLGVIAPDRDLRHLLLYGGNGDVAGVSGGAVAVWESRDGGQHWKRLDNVKSVPTQGAQTATIGDARFTIRADGLYRQRGATSTVVYPAHRLK